MSCATGDGLPPEVLARALHSTTSAVTIADATAPDLPLVYVNPAFEELTGFAAADVLGRNCRLLQGPDTDSSSVDPIRLALAEQRPARVVLRNRRPDGTSWWNELWIDPVRDVSGRVTHWIGLQRDVTHHVEDTRRMSRLAYSDDLTGLPNRAHLREHLDLALARADRGGGAVALLFLDLDGFKAVNDVHGHDVGDAVLRQAARRLSAAVRATDLLARHGGDEFLLLIADLPVTRAAHVAEAVAGQLREALSQPVEVHGVRVQLGASVGAALYPAEAHDAESLLRAADRAMYRVKQSRGSTGSDTTPSSDPV